MIQTGLAYRNSNQDPTFAEVGVTHAADEINLEVATVTTTDPIILVGKDNPGTSLNMGIEMEEDTDGKGTKRYHGIVRSHDTGEFIFYKNATAPVNATTTDLSSLTAATVNISPSPIFTSKLTLSNPSPDTGEESVDILSIGQSSDFKPALYLNNGIGVTDNFYIGQGSLGS